VRSFAGTSKPDWLAAKRESSRAGQTQHGAPSNTNPPAPSLRQLVAEVRDGLELTRRTGDSSKFISAVIALDDARRKNSLEGEPDMELAGMGVEARALFSELGTLISEWNRIKTVGRVVARRKTPKPSGDWRS
jgi:hypothetical protein